MRGGGGGGGGGKRAPDPPRKLVPLGTSPPNDKS